MYCVIQKVTNKKPVKPGHAKELMVDTTTLTYADGKQETSYSYRYSFEQFERPIKDAYKISIHESFRENGKVKKNQWVICTMSYYDLMEFWPGDCITKSTLNEKLEEMGIDEETLWNLVYEKLDPIIEELKKEFESTEEYKVKMKHDEILLQYRAAKEAFEEEYGSDTYKYCYDIFGTLRNKEYLEQLKAQKKAQEDYQRSYYRQQQSNYNYYNQSSYYTASQSNYTEEEKGMLKKIYRAASKQFHPDITKDDGTMMKFLTKLKEQWGI